MPPDFYNHQSTPTDNSSQEIIEVFEKKPDHHYRTEIPNIIFTLNLDPFELSLYLFLKRTAGDYSKCFKRVKTLAEESQMSERKLRECLKKLSSPLVNGKPLIKITHRMNPNGSFQSNIIEIIDIWRENGDFFRGGVLHEVQGGTASHAGGTAPGAVKEEPFKEEQHVVVVGEATPPPSVGVVHKKLSKDDIYHYSLAARKDWKPEEIESAWSSFELVTSTVTDPYAYIGGIINKKRILHTRKPKENSCSQTTPSCSKKKESEKSKSVSSNYDTWVPVLDNSYCPWTAKKLSPSS